MVKIVRIGSRLDVAGATVGLVALALSLTPSLLPRPAWGQGFVSGLAFAVGYGVGVLLWRGVARLSRGRLPAAAEAPVWAVALIGLAGAAALMPFALGWQNSVREAVGMPDTNGFDWFVAAVFFAIGAWLAFAIGRGVAAGYRSLHRLIAPRIPGRGSRPRVAASATGAATVVAMLAVLSIGLSVLSWLLTLASEHKNRQYDPEYAQPTSPLRSGSADSLVAWEDLGQAGVKVVAGGPTAADIELVTGAPAVEPIRVYVGVDVPGTFDERAQIAVDELERTGAADRSVLMIAGTTGSGWLDPAAIDGFEYLHAGDTALVTLQYGATGSPVSALLTPDLSQDGTTALVRAVTAWWEALPEDDRPQLLVYGLSLGSFGIQSAYDDAADLLASTEGAVLAGTPSFTPIWIEEEDARDAGSPYSLPVLDDGEHVRWSDEWGGLEALPGAWEDTRVAYLQHGNDPIVWIGPSVIWSEPAWLLPGQRSEQVSDDMVWIPVVTAFQGVIDLILSTAVPEDAGHKYGNLAVDALHQVAGDADLSDDAVARVRAVIEQYDTYSPVAN
ncbi:alpha/beta-hydrolase family protein [Demequina sp. SYSU T00192]|uniref:Alpha/beta-hydrolase family protein n=1 Tax=Demequina litoralis TaxID=3051660 RepID=A0ABT8G5Z6_9MICO|nr:alpha/beta-hydrolase family protein [Demequina sp. SYSU T00192]MDN4474354.1 alpha/beta-hydrolase family protein [Demequina sp. SYSU T00192]